MARAIIIVDHGSRREAANAMLEKVVGLLRGRTSDRVYAAHMELAPPTIRQAFDRAISDGATEVFVFPYFLSPGRHSREDIPCMFAEAAAGHPGIRWHCSGPIGLDPMLADLILARVGQCEANDYRCGDCPDEHICGKKESPVD
jgi:sirohydrochlorin ferrochelatase